VHDLAKVGDTDIDAFNRTLDQVAYHGHLALLLDAHRTAWPQIKQSEEIVPWGIDEFAGKSMNAEMFAWLEQHPLASADDLDDPQLLERLLFFGEGEINSDVMRSLIGRASGREKTVWSMDDFKLETPRGVKRRRDEDDDEPADPAGRRHLWDLSTEFLGYAHRQAGISWTRAELGRDHLISYIFDRHAGRLQESAIEGMSRALSNKPRPKPKGVVNVLCPDARSLDTYLARLLSPMGPQPAAAAALLMVLPAWLRFLESHHLIDAALRHSTLLLLAPLSDTLARVLEEWGEDTVAQGVGQWRTQAGLDNPQH
jgi:hypothetical protein